LIGKDLKSLPDICWRKNHLVKRGGAGKRTIR
jgi:hypothetical protein